MWLAVAGDQLECVWTAGWISPRICVRSDDGWVSFLRLQYALYISHTVPYRLYHPRPVGCGFCQVQQVVRLQEASRKFIAMNIPLHYYWVMVMS
jgi:hypothetical protein